MCISKKRSLSQDIFRFGGINSQIEYSKELRKLEELDLSINNKGDINSLYTLLIDIKIDDIYLRQNILNIKNSQIDVTQKKSEYKSGELGISDLNDALITKNNLQETHKTLMLSKQKNINSLKKYTVKKYESIQLPAIQIINKDNFLQKSSSLKYSSLNSNVDELSYKIKKSDYLPKLTFDTKYGYAKGDSIKEDDYYSYGLSISVPINFTSNNNIEQSKLEYLISKKELNDKLNSIELTYDEIIITIKNYKDKIKLANEDIKLYEELLSVNEEEFNAGYKTLDDVLVLQNTKEIRQLDIQSYKFSIQKELVLLYSMII